MSVLGKAKDYADNNPEKVELLIDEVGDFVDSKTDHKYADKVDFVQGIAKSRVKKPGKPATKEAPAAEPAAPTSSVPPVDGPPASPEVI